MSNRTVCFLAPVSKSHTMQLQSIDDDKRYRPLRDQLVVYLENEIECRIISKKDDTDENTSSTKTAPS